MGKLSPGSTIKANHCVEMRPNIMQSLSNIQHVMQVHTHTVVLRLYLLRLKQLHDQTIVLFLR